MERSTGIHETAGRERQRETERDREREREREAAQCKLERARKIARETVRVCERKIGRPRCLHAHICFHGLAIYLTVEREKGRERARPSRGICMHG